MPLFIPLNRATYYTLSVCLLLLITGIFLYQYWKTSDPEGWHLIPDNAILVIESTDPLQLHQTWKQSANKQGLHTLPHIQKVLTRLHSIAEFDEDVQKFFRKKQILTSLHITTRNDFDYVFFLPIQSEEEEQVITELAQEFKESKRYKWHTRLYQKQTITEISQPSAKATFSYVVYGQHLIGSFSPFLIENVVRHLNKGMIPQKNTWSTLAEGYTSTEATLQVYVQSASLPRFLQVFTDEPFTHSVSSLLHYAQSSKLHYSTEPNLVKFDGHSHVPVRENKPYFLRAFINQRAQPVSCLPVIPSNTAILMHWGFSDAKKLAFSLQQYWAANDAATLKAQDQVKTKYHISPGAFTDWMANELALAFLEGYTANKLLFIKATDTKKALTSLRGIADSVKAADHVLTFAETFSDIPIRQVALANFPAIMLGASLEGFKQCFYAPVGKYIVFAESVQSLKKLILDVQAGNVWENAGPIQELLKKSDTKSNISLVVNTTRARSLLQAYAAPGWKKYMQTHADGIKNVKYAALLLQHEQNDKFRTQLLVGLEEKVLAQNSRKTFISTATSTIDYNLQTPPYLVRNHADKSREILAQDINKQLYLINSQGKVLWKKPLPKTIVSQIQQIDFYKNNKLQYLFATNSAIYTVDRNGNTLEGFPVNLPDTVQLHTVAAIDYDNNHDYRFLASDRKGDLFLFGKDGKLLEGWNPLKLPYGYGLSSAASHVRVQGKDYIVVPQANGIIQVLTRKGKPYEGFPFLINDRIHNPLFIEMGADASTTALTALTDNGEISTFNLLGELLAQRQLYRPDKSTLFKIIIEATGKDWLIARQDNKTVSILDKNGKVLFEKEHSSPKQTIAQLYDFGGGLRIIAVTDPLEKQTYLYDLAGNPISNGFIKNSHPVSILHLENSEKLLIYRSVGQEIGMVSIQL